ncbi:MAG: LytR C-terminal domain-containing protein [Pseudonocardia sp.]
MGTGSDRSRRSPADTPVQLNAALDADEILHRHGLLDSTDPAPEPATAPRSGRAARRRAADEQTDEQQADKSGQADESGHRLREPVDRPAANVVPRQAGRMSAPPPARGSNATAPAHDHPPRRDDRPDLRAPTTKRLASGTPAAPAAAAATSDRTTGSVPVQPAANRTSSSVPAQSAGGRTSGPVPHHASDAGERTDRAEQPSPRSPSGMPRALRTVTITRRHLTPASRIAAAALAGLVFAVAALGWSAKAWLDSAVPVVAALESGSDAIRDAAAQSGDENILMINSYPVVRGAPRSSGDTVVVVHVTAEGDRTVALALPSMLEINRPPCERWDPASASYLDQTVPAEARAELLSAFELGGPRCMTRTVAQLTGLAITGFVAVDLDWIAALVDAVHGVQVCATNLDGARAQDFVRAGAPGGEPTTDYGRVERQYRVLGAMLDETLSVGTLLDPGELRALGDAVAASTVADGVDLDRMLALARTLSRLDADGVTFAAVPTGAEPNLRGHTVLRSADSSALFAALREGTALPEQDDPRAVATGPAPADVTVDVLNAADRAGLAGRVGQQLGDLGFGVDDVGNADRVTTGTVIRFSADRAEAATLLASSLPSATTKSEPGTSGVLELVLGSTFDGVVRTVERSAPPPVTRDVTRTCT